MGGDLSVEGVVAKVNPAVVSIVASKDVPVIEQYFDNSSPFGDFFGMQIPQYRQNGTQKQEIGSGSGFFVSSDGLVVTNKHVVSDTQAEYTVITSDNKKYTATVLARDPFLDVAIVKIDKKDTPYLELGNSDQLKLGQSVIAIGNALGQFRNSISVGVVSGLSRSIVAGDGGSSENLDQVIQTDAAINPGNSGGPLLDLQGKVIGVNVAVAQGSENVGFALPISIVKGVVDSVKQYGSIFRPYLGIRYVQIDQALKDKNNLSVDYGVLIARGINPGELAVIPGSPADKAGLVENDIILSIDGQKLTSDGSQTLAYIIRQKKIGDSVTLRVLSKGQEKEVKLKLEKSPN
ncbi:MAG: hypothetical protein C3F02_03075 [Parcubacteria group bacterium]|nr:MAG: hypothetical protein C3F02_03075 [Parcubacteria group bacterium]